MSPGDPRSRTQRPGANSQKKFTDVGVRIFMFGGWPARAAEVDN
jgi:hypothetical protein